jgi:hypothetical protein
MDMNDIIRVGNERPRKPAKVRTVFTDNLTA